MNITKNNKIIGTIDNKILKNSPVYKASISFNLKNNKEKFNTIAIEDIIQKNTPDYCTSEPNWNYIFTAINNHELLKYIDMNVYNDKNISNMYYVKCISDYLQVESIKNICDKYLYPYEHGYKCIHMRSINNDYTYSEDNTYCKYYGFINRKTLSVINLINNSYIKDEINYYYKYTNKDILNKIDDIYEEIIFFKKRLLECENIKISFDDSEGDGDLIINVNNNTVCVNDDFKYIGGDIILNNCYIIIDRYDYDYDLGYLIKYISFTDISDDDLIYLFVLYEIYEYGKKKSLNLEKLEKIIEKKHDKLFASIYTGTKKKINDFIEKNNNCTSDSKSKEFKKYMNYYYCQRYNDDFIYENLLRIKSS